MWSQRPLARMTNGDKHLLRNGMMHELNVPDRRRIGDVG